jgi:hypothetical protein
MKFTPALALFLAAEAVFLLIVALWLTKVIPPIVFYPLAGVSLVASLILAPRAFVQKGK